jgi:hypothetical protein
MGCGHDKILKREVHLALDIGKDAELGDFLREPLTVGGGVGVLNADEHEQAAFDASGDAAGDGHTGRGNTLEDGAHTAAIRQKNAMRKSSV